MTDMKPCPFCGDDRAATYYVRDGRIAMCPACGARSGSQFNGPLDLPNADDRAIAAWNRRADAPEVQAIVAKAVAEERERCAKVAERYAADHDPEDNETQFFLHEEATCIAAAIRSRT